MQANSGNNIIDFLGDKYYLEKLSKGIYTLSQVKKVLYRKQSRYQLIEILDMEGCGKALYLDGMLQFCVNDEHIYHEVFVHPPMLAHDNPRKILIIGGGDGGVLREVLKYKSVDKVDLVELDKEVVEAIKRFMPEIPERAFEDHRVSIHFEDGLKFLQRKEEKYDIIFVDVTDSVGPSTVFYKAQTYRLFKDKVKENGIIVYQALGILEHKGAQIEIKKGLKEFFRYVSLYAVYVPNFCQLWSFAAASNAIDFKNITVETIRNRFSERGVNTLFYTPDLHLALFAIEPYINFLLIHCVPQI